ncbi:MAG: TonB-dependent receptor [Novosphingobium sp.]|nr:TonB-dependent receptor [Novosphingobium sp.]
MLVGKILTSGVLAGSASMLALAAPAAAQDAADQPSDGIEEIIVTAQKRAESLQDTPISIAAFNAEDLEAKGITGLTDLRAQVPNLQLTPFPNNAATTQIFLRGVGLSDDQITQDGGVAVYQDGVYVARSQGQALEVAELERVEVLRGPQGTLYGRNATGGAINFITRKPDLGEFGFKGQVSIGNYDIRKLKAAVNVPVGERLAARFSYLNSKQDGFVRNLGTGVKRFGDKDRQAFRGDVLWQPLDALSLRYAYDRSEIQDTPVFVAFSPLHPLRADRPTAGSPLVRDLLRNDIVTQGHSLTAEWEAADSLTIRSITAYRKLDNFQNQNYLTGVLGPTPLQNNMSRLLQNQWSQELQLVGDLLDDQVEYVLGAYYFDEDGSNFSNSFSPPTATRSFTTATIANRSYAVFGQATFRPEWFERKLALTLGARHSWDKREATLVRSTQVGAGPVTPVPGVGDGSRSFRNFSPSVTLGFDVSDDIHTYVKAVRGYKSGGFNIRASSIARFNDGFEPETLWSYEAGLKSQFLDDRVRFNVAGFHSKYRDIQINVQSDPTNARITDVLNAGSATVNGVEADLTLAPSRNLRVGLNYGFLDPSYDEILDARGVDISPNFRFTQSPRHTLAADITYDLPRLPIGRLTANIGYTMQSEKFSSSTIAQGKFIIGDYGLLNARLTLAEIPGLNGVKLAAWARNIADKEYYVFQFNIGRPGAIFGEPRTYGLDLIAEF